MATSRPADGYYAHGRPELLGLLETRRGWGGTALDVGCGEGRFGEALFGLGFRSVWGVEPAPEPARSAAGRLTHVVEAEFPCDEVSEGAPFELVVFADSLEHLSDPWTALAAARQELTQTGWLALSVPNVAHYTVVWQLMRGNWAYADEGLLDRSHLRFFTPPVVERMLGDVGFRVVARRDVVCRPGRLLDPLVRVWSRFSPDVCVVQSLFLAQSLPR